MCVINPTYVPVDLAVPWILAKAAEVERGRAEAGEQGFVAPSWLTNKSCKRQLVVIDFWERSESISEEEARQLHKAVGVLQGNRRFNPRATERNLLELAAAASPTEGEAAWVKEAASASTEPCETPPATASPPACGVDAGTTEGADSKPDPAPQAPRPIKQPPSLKSAKVVPSGGEDDPAHQDRSLPPTGGAPDAAAPTHGEAPGAPLQSQAQALGVRASFINPRRRSALGGVALVLSLAKELVEVMREATRTEAAVAEWWDVNVGAAALGEDRRGVVRELLVALAEALWPALLLARVFLRV